MKLVVCGLILVLGFGVRSLHAVDLAPLMSTSEQPMAVLSSSYSERAESMLGGRGILIPDGISRRDTGLLSFTPGYSFFLAAVYGLAGDSPLVVQLFQNLLSALIPVLVFLLGERLVSWRTGAVAGILAASAHFIAFYSELILPDALCALPLLIGVYLLAEVVLTRSSNIWRYAIAGALFGSSVWLRPNSLLLSPFLTVFPFTLYFDRRRLVPRGALMTCVALLVVAPITIRNYVIYHRFVPVSINIGIVMWEGLADAGGERFGAVKTDEEVGRQEVETYGNPEYAWWASPDGIDRDRARVTRSLRIIASHPAWYAGSVLKRMGGMLNYAGEAPMIRREGIGGSVPAGAPRWALIPGRVLWWLPGPVRFMERTIRETTLPMILVGGVVVLGLSFRRALLLLSLPAYYLLTQPLMHTEFRYTLPMQCFMLIIAGAGWVAAGGGILASMRFVRAKLWRTRSAGAEA